MNHVEQIKERLSIVDVVGGYVPLRQAGRNYTAKCPFHTERTPSFFVSAERGTYYCFGCGAKGDIFTFIEGMEGLDFRGALGMLAQRAGVELVPEDPGARDARTRLFSVLDEAARYFESECTDMPEARAYLTKERGMSEESIAHWRIGYARPQWRAVHDYFTARGYDSKELIAAGLCKERGGRVYDVFRGRIMFPIRDTAGRVVAFSGRAFETHGIRDGEPPKYINSPETEVFEKSRILYGLDVAREGIRRLACAIVVEGQVDVILAHQAGFTNTVGLSGTALTHEQITKLDRLSHNLILAFDADNAGMRAIVRSAGRALSVGMDVKVAMLPGESDPADLIKTDVEAWKKLIKNARHVIEVLIDVIERECAEGRPDPRMLRLRVTQDVLPIVAQIRNKVDQEHFIGVVAERINISPEAVRDEMRRQAAARTEVPRPAAHAPQRTPDVHPVLPAGRRDVLEARIVGIIVLSEAGALDSLDASGLIGDLKQLLGEEGYAELYARYAGGEREALSFETETELQTVDDVDAYAAELLALLSRERFKEEYDEALGELRRIEAGGESSEAHREALARCRDLARKLEDIE